MNRLIELDIIVRTLIGRLVEFHGAANLADYLEHLAHQLRRQKFWRWLPGKSGCRLIPRRFPSEAAMQPTHC